MRLFETDLGLAGRALEGAPAVAHAARGFVLALGDPLQHTVLVSFETARARVDPGPVGLLGVGLEADKADMLRIAERCGHGTRREEEPSRARGRRELERDGPRRRQGFGGRSGFEGRGRMDRG